MTPLEIRARAFHRWMFEEGWHRHLSCLTEPCDICAVFLARLAREMNEVRATAAEEWAAALRKERRRKKGAVKCARTR